MKKLFPALLAGGAIAGVAKSSPAMKQVSSQFGSAMTLFFRPFGNFLASVLRPATMALMNMALNFNKAVEQEGGLLGGIKKFLNDNLETKEAGGFKFKPVGSADWFKNLTNNSDNASDSLDDLETTNASLVPSLKDLKGVFNTVKNAWPGWPNLNTLWTNTGGWPNVGNLWNNMGGWPDINLPGDFWPDLQSGNILDNLIPNTPSAQDIIDKVLSDEEADETPNEKPCPGPGGGTYVNDMSECPGVETGSDDTNELGDDEPGVDRGEVARGTQTVEVNAELKDKQIVNELKKIKQNTQSGTTELDPFTNTGA